ncbi:TlpA disulfide reductase family protein [Brevundimonas sp.]|uniref:TlpA family protein disulfide reductase n=1 Tax=Brevundimonas sp. TaxID=1871086 RepID=UPI0028967D2F|nr:TlpA disulfide reductase family protein [Brevundimonas sp.]
MERGLSLEVPTAALPPAAVTLATLSSEPLDLAQPAGRPTVINLWATWRPPCRREMPALAETETQHPDVRFLFVNQGEGAETAGRFLEAEGRAGARPVRPGHGRAAPRRRRPKASVGTSIVFPTSRRHSRSLR